MKILYISCTCGYNKLLANKYSLDGYQIRAVNLNNDWKLKSMSYGIDLPFIVIDNKAFRI